MTQHTKIIDVTKSILITDPKSYMQNIRYSEGEDYPEKNPAIVAFEHLNILPTSYGYKSYFGENSTLNIAALPSRCDRVILFQQDDLTNTLIALCEDGLWYSSSLTVASSAWVQGITLTIPPVGTYKEWTYCIIENLLYVYRQGEPSYWTIDTSLTITPVVPSFLNMAGQLGIFRANTSLGFWDSANLVAWSSPLDHADFTPSVSTLAGNAIFSGILGRIVIIKSQGDNFIIYTTKGIVGVRYVNSTTVIWEATSITDTAGISNSKEVTTSLTEMEQYAYTDTGIKKVGSYNALSKVHAFEEVFTDIYDLLKESEPSVYLEFLNGRYLLICLLSDTYIDGLVSVETDTVDPFPVNILVNGVPYDGLTVLPSTVNGGVPLIQEIGTAIVTVGGPKNGMYLEWSVTGIGSFSANTTPMHYFELDSHNNYVPNPTTDIGPNFIVFGDAETAPVGTYIVKSTPDFPVDSETLRYQSYGSLAAGVSQLGVVDSSLATFIGAQLAEWDTFITTQTNNIAAIASIFDSPEVITATSYYFLGSENTTREIQKIAAAFTASATEGILASVIISLDSCRYTDIEYGSFLSGQGTTEAAILTGVGTNAAHYEVTRNFVGGHKIKKKALRTYYAVFNATQYGVWRTTFGAKHAYFNPSWYVYGASPAECFAQFESYNPPAEFMYGPIRYHSPYIGPDVTTNENYSAWIYHFVIYEGTPSEYTGVTPMLNMYKPDSWRPAFSSNYKQVTADQFLIKYKEHKYIDVSADTSITGSSTLTADQHNITWMLASEAPNSDPGYPLTDPTGQLLIPGVSILGGVIPGADFGYTYPGANFLLQDGVPSPIYPDYVGALVYDTALKKWGKAKLTFTALIDYNIFNGNNPNSVISYTDLGIDMGILKNDGTIRNIDAHPSNSYLLYGKLGLTRLGNTRLYEVIAGFRNASDVTLSSYVSRDGVSLDVGSLLESVKSAKINNILFIDNSGRWHVVKVSGLFDLHQLKFKASISGRR